MKLRQLQLRSPKLFAISCGVVTGLMMYQLWLVDTVSWSLPVAFVPLFYLWLTCTSKRLIVWSSWLAQFVFGLLTYDWLRHTAFTFYGTDMFGSALFLFAFACIAHLGWVLAALLWCAIRNSKHPVHCLTPVTLVVLVTWIDYVTPQFFPIPFGQPWLWSQTPVFQLAEWIGFKGLSLVTYSINVIVTYPLIAGTKKSWFQSMSIVGGFIAALSFLGQWRAEVWAPTDSVLTPHLVQIFIEPIEMLEQQMGREKANAFTLDRFIELHKQAPYQRSDVIIWSETALPIDVTVPSIHLQRFSDFVRQNKTPLITGAYRYDTEHKKYNSAAHFDSNGQLVQVSDKHLLMPFGEYLPGEEFFPFLRKLLPQVPNYGLGIDWTPFAIGDARMGVGICYDALFPSESRHLTTAGANFFLTLTGEYWFGPTAEPLHHGALAMARAIEFRRPLVRVADTGLTFALKANGEPVLVAPLWEPWQGTIEIPFLKNPERTFFDRFGKFNPWILLIALCGLIVIGRRNATQSAT